ncbi:MAG TPA: ABC transporter permease [Aeromicrobium sp.]|nr:ABC transporter permease [Aeromicrobium sp.]HKY58874.1 ABC transporter permease [Aeromicrobium sp.]
MTWRDTVITAWHGLTANVLRSALTMLGILIGVAAVIVLVAVGNGSAKAVNDAISALGTNTITVQAGRGEPGSFKLTQTMADALEDENLCPHVATVSPTITASATAAASQRTSSIDQVVGTVPSWFAAQNQPVETGRKLTSADVANSARVVVLAATTAEDLFGAADDAVGQRVKLGATSFQVVGILKSQGTGPSAFMTTAVAPISTVRTQLAGNGPLSSIVVQASDADSIGAAQAEVETVLRGLGHLNAGTTELPFSLQNASSLLETQESSGRTFTVLLGVVAGISLLVGGLGITNIMLVTVTERTREIGVRKALGAPRRTILRQFLLESSLLSLAGGLLGTALGLAVSQIDIIGITPVVVPGSVALALGVCLVIGVFFGSFPANRAAGLRPVDALRHE